MDEVILVTAKTKAVALVLLLTGLVHASSGTCQDQGRFGATCQLVCNCEGGAACEPNGTCPGSCQPAWAGPTCQIRLDNVALGKPTEAWPKTKNESLSSDRAVDDKTDVKEMGTWVQGSDQDGHVYWYVDTRADHMYHTLQIWFYDPATDQANVMKRRLGYSIRVANLSDPNVQSNNPCYQDDISKNTTPAFVDITTCNVRGRYVFVYNVRNNDTASKDLSNWANLELVEVKAWADLGCAPGIYGMTCDRQCSVNCAGFSCDRVSGDCTVGCKTGWYLGNCSQQCSHCNGTCNITSGYCDQCPPGFTGNKCETACPQNCLDSLCSTMVDTSVVCKECIPGYYGDHCDSSCENCNDKKCHKNGTCLSGCESGHYGEACDQRCDGACVGGCKQKNGVCAECSPAKFGDFCALECDYCDSFLCDRNGSCSKGCIDKSLSGSFCNQTCTDIIQNCLQCENQQNDLVCMTCQNATYGRKCENSCPSGCSLCESELTCTACKLGFKGKNCTEHCTDPNCEDCEASGKCSLCLPGYYGLETDCNGTCDTNCYRCIDNTHCSKCNKGSYLVISATKAVCLPCNDSCAACNDQTCTECKVGFFGQQCGKCPKHCLECESIMNCTRCESLWYGQSCQCSDHCVQQGSRDNWCATNGTCLLGCKNGFTGNTCLQISCGYCKNGVCGHDGSCVECEDGFYGQQCNLRCPPNCANGKCNIITGRCDSCKAHFFGPYCQQNCSIHCDGECNQMTGTCDGCKSNFFGPTCNQQCPARCGPDPLYSDRTMKKIVCHRVLGLCVFCASGYFGDNCTEACSPNCDSGMLNLFGSCRKDDGSCYQCSDGHYGIFCEQNCSQHCVGPCSQVNGECINCTAGWYNKTCDTPCSDKCLERTCIQSTGSCKQGCQKGYTGQMCLVKAPEESNDGSLVIIIVVLVIILVLAVLAAVMFIYYRRRQTGLYHRSNGYNGDIKLRTITKENAPLLPTMTNGKGTSGCNQLPLPERDKKGEDDGMDIDDADLVICNTDPSDYYNLGSLIPVDSFSEYLRDRRTENPDWFRVDFQKLPKGLLKSCQIAKLPSNLVKCRYKLLYPYDETRVKLDPERNFKSDFINASYIKGYKKPEAFIAAQGPTDANVNDFWRMIFQKDCGKIVMLTNLFEELKMKCVCYWPEAGCTEKYGNYDVTMTSEHVFTDYTVRQLTAVNSITGESKDFRLFHFTAWPDRGVPENPACMLHFREKVLEEDPLLPAGPLLVHCSAGIGRTGTFVALDYLLRQAKEERHIDVFRTITDMRYQRTNFIQTDVQYEFLHYALEEALTTQVMEVTAADFCTHYWGLLDEDHDTGRTKLQEQFDILNKMAPDLEASACLSGMSDDNVAKNRHGDIIPVDRYRAYLSTPVPGANEYINGVFLPTCSNKTAFIVTQMPLPNTVVDFWRLVYDQHATTVVMMNNPQDRDETYGEYWPSDDCTYGPFKVELFSCENSEHFSILSFQLTYTSQSRQSKMMIRQYRLEGWGDEEMVPSSTKGLLALITAVSQLRHSQPDKPTIVHCMDGAERSGLFCALSAILERLDMTQSVNIPQTILQLRSRRPQLIQTLEQYEFCYRAAADHLSANQIYSNVP